MWFRKKEKVMSKVFETKWGFVAYSYEDYKKLKQLNKIFYKARTHAARWNRWARKDEHNRVEKKWLRNEEGQKIGFEVIGPLNEPVVCPLFSKKHRWFDQYVTDKAVEVEYRNSHRPVLNEEDVIERGFSSSDIDKLLEQAEEWLATL